MSYKIVVDSCCELPQELLQTGLFERVPLALEVGEYQILDDESFDQAQFLEKVAACPQCPKSSCPSPERFMEAYDVPVDHVYCVTLSSHLSGSYNSALLGKNLLQEKFSFTMPRWAKESKRSHVSGSRWEWSFSTSTFSPI